MSPLNNQKGQALIETLISLPFTILALSGTIGLAHFSISYKLTDHWTYEAAICLSKFYPKNFCSKELRRKIDLLPYVDINLRRIYRSANQVSLKGSTQIGPVFSKKWVQHLSIPLEVQ